MSACAARIINFVDVRRCLSAFIKYDNGLPRHDPQRPCAQNFNFLSRFSLVEGVPLRPRQCRQLELYTRIVVAQLRRRRIDEGLEHRRQSLPVPNEASPHTE